MFPINEHPYFGIHVKEQIDHLKNHHSVNSSVFFINSFIKGRLEYFRSLRNLIKLIKKGRFDIIHIHYGLSGFFLIFYRPKTKIFLTLHGGDILSKQGKSLQVKLTKLILPMVNKVILLNQEMIDIVKQYNNNYVLLPCGVDINFFKPNPDVIKNKNIKTILFPGDPNREVKNFPLFLAVVDELCKNESYKIEIKTVHNLDRQGVVDVLTYSDCLVMTSFSEGSPQIIKEAIACNLPVVSVPVGDVENVLRDITACFVTKSFDVQELTEKIIQSLDYFNPSVRNEFIDKGNLDSITIGNRIKREYEKAIL